MKANAYKDAGVDIEAGDALVERIKPFAKSTTRSGTMGGLGGFGALFDTKAAGFVDPILVSSTDGVGTKLRVAIDANHHKTVGIDLVAMCVNDILVQGAEPLFFLDYFASSQLNVDTAADVIQGIAEGCRQANCALIGGETAEMPSMYHTGDYDLAGFSVGAVERDRVLTGASIVEGDIIIGIASSGVHSNGYSLVRKIIKDNQFSYSDTCPITGQGTLGETLLTPTKIYIASVLPLLKSGNMIKGLAHITGGGLTENIPRVLPDGLGAELDATTWVFPPVFQWLKTHGHLSDADMAVTFNCGIGMVAVVSPADTDTICAALNAAGETATCIGHITTTDTDNRVILNNTESQWTTQ